MKYYLSLCCIIKDEKYLEEFIIYYRILGVEHFYIYDNDSSIPIKERLNNNYYQRMCTIINFPGKAQQMNAYNDFFKNYGSKTKWAIIVDGDEYILPKKVFSIRDFLKIYNDYHAVGINWVMFGSSYHEKTQSGYVIDNYRFNEGCQNKHIKTICKPEFVIKMDNPHYVNLKDPSKYIDPNKKIIKGPFNENKTNDVIQINHYWGKSMEDLVEKINRGRAPVDKKREMPEDYHNKDNTILDNLICDKYLKLMIEIKKEHNLSF
jgi:hypothetical protein